MSMDGLFLFLDIHAAKLLLLTVGVICCVHVDILHVFLLLLTLSGIWFLGHANRTRIIRTIMVTVALLKMSKLLYQTNFVSHSDAPKNCTTDESILEYGMRIVGEPKAKWFGFVIDTVPSLWGYFSLLGLGTVLHAIHITMVIQYGEFDLPKIVPLFPGVRRVNVDYSVMDAIKYLINYGFYKFGLECCQIAFALVIVSRRDAFALVYGVCLLLTISGRKRKTVRTVWPIICCIVAFSILYQYLMVLGTLPDLCYEYPRPLSQLHIRKWLYLPYHDGGISPTLIIGDIVLLLLLRQQSIVFSVEDSPEYIENAGDNGPIRKGVSYNPLPDHTKDEWTLVDVVKLTIFSTLYWGSLAAGFKAGMGADLLAIGFLGGAFLIFWQGADIYSWKIRSLSTWWRVFCIFSALSLIIKSSVTEITCNEYKNNEDWKWTFAVVTGSLCDRGQELYWEVASFCFFLFQKRYFQSHYFQHAVNDFKASQKLQSSGAAIILKLRKDRLQKEVEARQAIIRKLKEEMKILKAYYFETGNKGNETHDHAVFSGEYYMLDETQRTSAPASIIGANVRRRRTLITFNEFLEMENEESSPPTPIEEDLEEKKTEESESISWSEVRNRIIEKAKILPLFFLNYVAAFIDDHIIPFLNRMSHNYRVVAWAMMKDRSALKREGSHKYEDFKPVQLNMDDFKREENQRIIEINVWARLIIAIWYALMAHSELLCYFAVFLHQVLLPSLLSLPLPLMVLLWGALTRDHPSLTFWSTLTAYTHITIILKALFRNELFPWTWKSSHVEEDIFYPPNVIGIDQKGVVTSADILLLIILYIHRFLEHFKPLKAFFAEFKEANMLPTDVYTYSFLCEFLTFLVIFFGFSSFSPVAAGKDVDKFNKLYLMENEVPVSYLITLIIQFFIMIIDRVLYLKKLVVGKLIFHVTQVITAHIWLFLLLPGITNRAFHDLAWPQVWYTFKFLAFMLSAYQLRAGFPLRVGGHFLCRQYGLLHLYLFRIMKFIPLFNQIRQCINWICYKTSLTWYEWQHLCSMNSAIYDAKCMRQMQSRDNFPRGEARTSKLPGGIMLLIILLLIWAPLILFSLFKTVSESFPLTEATFSMRINTYQDLYYFQMQPGDIAQLDKSEYTQMKSLSRNNVDLRLFLDQYDNTDVSVLKLNPASRSTWGISPAEINQLRVDLMNNSKHMIFTISWTLTRQTDAGELIGRGRYEAGLTSEEQGLLLSALDSSTEIVHINVSVPLNIENKDKTADTVVFEKGDGMFGYGQLVFTLKSQDKKIWWEITDKCINQTTYRRQAAVEDCKRVVLFVFSPKLVTGILKFVSAKGIVGVYVSVVFVVCVLLRQMGETLYQNVRFNWLPNVDSVLQLSQDIFLARECGEFLLEEDLFAKLIFLFRSPETMIKWTSFRETSDAEDSQQAADIEV